MGTESKSGRRRGRHWRVAFLVLCGVGICLSAYLARVHFKVHTDSDYRSICELSEALDCSTVALSKYSVVLGLPLAHWGLLAYTLMGILAARGLRRRSSLPSWPFGVLLWLALLATVAAAVLFWISHYRIRSLCLVCTATYGVNVALAIVAGLELRRSGGAPFASLIDEGRAVQARPRPFLAFGGWAAAVVLIVCFAVPAYWAKEGYRGPGGIRVGRTAAGHPWIGAADPVAEIVEFSDYQCPHCQRGHNEMRALVEAHPDRLRLVHRHYPLDRQCNPAVQRQFHSQACSYARMAFCAGEQGRFWEANDYLFARGRDENPVGIAELGAALDLDSGALGLCVGGDKARRAIEEDLRAAREFDVRGTPTYVFGDRVYPGRIPPEVIGAALGVSVRRVAPDES